MPLPEQNASSGPTVGAIGAKPPAPAGSTSIWIVPYWNTVPQTEHSALKVISTRSGAVVAKLRVVCAPAAVERSTGTAAAPKSCGLTLVEKARMSAEAWEAESPTMARADMPISSARGQ